MQTPSSFSVYGVREIPARRSTPPRTLTPRIHLIGLGIEMIVDLYQYCKVEAEFDLSPGENALRIYRSSTGSQLYQARIRLEDGQPAIIIEPLTSLAVHYLWQVEFLS